MGLGKGVEGKGLTVGESEGETVGVAKSVGETPGVKEGAGAPSVGSVESNGEALELKGEGVVVETVAEGIV